MPRHPGWTALALACAGQFMVVLDISIVNVALPSIRADLGFDDAGLQWVVNAYALTLAGFLLLGGRAADLYGRRRVFVFGLALFTVASLLGGLASTATLLIIARAGQGIGAAVLAPATLTILTTTHPDGPARLRALAAWSAIGATGGAAGAVLGGILTDLLSWRWVLLVNVPAGAALIIAALRLLPGGRDGTTSRRLDLLGALTVTAGLSILAYAVIQTHVHGWTSRQTLIPFALSAAALTAFLVIQARFAHNPLMPLRLFRSRAVTGANLVIMLMGAAGFTVWYFLSLYLQNVLHYSALRAGLAFLPHTATLVLGARVAARLLPRWGTRPMVVGGTLAGAAGFLWQAQITPTSGYLTGVMLPGILICGGLALAFTPLASAATTGVAHTEAGLVSGLLNSSRQVGGSIGLAVLATVAAGYTATAGDSPTAVTAGYSRAFLVSGGFLLAGAVAVLTLPRPAGPA